MQRRMKTSTKPMRNVSSTLVTWQGEENQSGQAQEMNALSRRIKHKISRKTSKPCCTEVGPVCADRSVDNLTRLRLVDTETQGQTASVVAKQDGVFAYVQVAKVI